MKMINSERRKTASLVCLSGSCSIYLGHTVDRNKVLRNYYYWGLDDSEQKLASRDIHARIRKQATN